MPHAVPPSKKSKVEKKFIYMLPYMSVKMGKFILFGLIYVWIINMWKYKQKERVCACSVTQTCLTLCDPMDCSLTGFSVHRSSQARILEWVAISSSRESSWPRDQTHVSYVSCIKGGFFTTWATWALQNKGKEKKNTISVIFFRSYFGGGVRRYLTPWDLCVNMCAHSQSLNMYLVSIPTKYEFFRQSSGRYS